MDHLVGKSITEVKQWAQENSRPLRITSQDGVGYVLTCDFVPHRLNVVVEDGIVKKIDLH
jgi:hypothetical protein